VQAENPENVVFVVPRAAAQHLVSATNDEQVQAALLDSQIFVNAEPFTLWVNGNRPSDEDIEKMRPQKRAKAAIEVASLDSSSVPSPRQEATVSPRLLKAPDMPVRLITPQTLSSLKTNYATVVLRMTYGLEEQAHFVSYAPPDFVGFHEGAYLQLSLETRLEAALATGSRYKVAALAFDEHVSHLVRPVLAYFQQSSDFDGILFSTTVKRPDGQQCYPSRRVLLPVHHFALLCAIRLHRATVDRFRFCADQWRTFRTKSANRRGRCQKVASELFGVEDKQDWQTLWQAEFGRVHLFRDL
jgi:hypothetical protein